MLALPLMLLKLGAAPVTTEAKVDNFGYRAGDAKVAVFSADPGSSVEVRRASDDTVVYTVPADGGSITFKGSDGADSGDTIWWVDFSGFATGGTYRLLSAQLGAQSYDFEIRDDIYNLAVLAGLKTYFYQRCNLAKEAPFAGDWADAAACHSGDRSTTNAAGHVNRGSLDLAGGHHDAGDYNKYVWTALSTSVFQMLRAYEDNPGIFIDNQINIPESGNGIPDLLDEIKIDLDWMLKMQLADGSVLYQMHVDGFASESPPSVDTNPRLYHDPNDESGAVFAGTLAAASRVFAAEGMTAYADTLNTAAINAWGWLEPRSNTLKQKVWAAAEIFRMDPTQLSAQSYVDNYYLSTWSGRFFDPLHYDTHAAVTYIQTPGATSAVVTNMRANVSAQMDYLFSEDDLYRNGMPAWAYFWGSNQQRAATGLLMLQAAKLGETGGRSAAETTAKALEYLHFFHGQNAMSMVYLTNMAALGGEHSSFQFYHAWFGDSTRTFSEDNYIGPPASVNEPAYPYFRDPNNPALPGVDNHGVSDDETSLHGPPPGFVPGGPNANYSGTASPPGGATASNRYYRDWNDQTADWTSMTWEITENSIGYQGPYVALGAYFMAPPVANCTTDVDCDDGLFCYGSETCSAGSCLAGGDPCSGQACDEDTDTCEVLVCDNDGTCEAGEDCNNCPGDCVSGGGGGFGNGICEPSLGEDCTNTSDCRGKTNGNPSRQFCCGAGTDPCGDSRCNSNGFLCTTAPAGEFCCGDAICDSGESCGNCDIDCAAVPETGLCGDGLDNDCNGLTDCADGLCSTDPVCEEPPPPACDGDGVCEPGEDCDNCASDCDGKSTGRPSGRFCCCDGTEQSAEVGGAVCDGNV